MATRERPITRRRGASEPHQQQVRTCPSTRSERVIRGIIALVLAAFAVSLLPAEPIPGIAAGVMALGIAASAITGACPRNWLGPQGEPTALGFVDARSAVNLSPTPHQRP